MMPAANRVALITGVSGQDGWYLASLLLRAGYTVHGQSRHLKSTEQLKNIHWHVGDLTNAAFLENLIQTVLPDEIYNLAAVSRPSLSWSIPLETALLNAFVPQQICELLLRHRPACRMFQASSSEIFGDTKQFAQNENSPRNPISPYAVSKDYAHKIVGIYRKQYGLHLSTGILFNHESPRRPVSFVSQKITFAAAAVAVGLTETTQLDERGRPLLFDGKVKLGDISIRRDFGFAGDFAEAMHLIVQDGVADDYVIGTGHHHSIQEICEVAFASIGRDWTEHVISDPDLIRRDDNHYTHADIAKIQSRLDWTPKTEFVELIRTMVSEAKVSLMK